MPGLVALGNNAARLPALLESTLRRDRTSLCRDRRGLDCNEENGEVRNGALRWRAPAREWLRRSVPFRSDRRRCRYTDCRIRDRFRWRACTRRWRPRYGPENDRSSRERCRPRQWDKVRARIDRVRRPGRNRPPFGLGKRLGEFPRLSSGFPGSWCRLLTYGFGGVKSTTVPVVRRRNLYVVPGPESGNYGNKKRRWRRTWDAETVGWKTRGRREAKLSVSWDRGIGDGGSSAGAGSGGKAGSQKGCDGKVRISNERKRSFRPEVRRLPLCG